jgi:hypothetical protein
MIMKKFFTFLFVLCILKLDAQTIDDILKVAYQDYEGTARFAAMGGAFGALGGDISNIGINPAGVAIFRKSHVSFTSSLNQVYNNSDFAGINTDNSRLYAGVSSIGAVIPVDNQDGTGLNVGVTYLKKTNFNRRTVAGNAFWRKINNRLFFCQSKWRYGFFCSRPSRFIQCFLRLQSS